MASERFAMKFILTIVIALAARISTPQAQESAPAASNPPSPQATASTAPASDGLADLDAMVFECPKAGLNAAAREAAKAPSQGTYQFSYFSILNDAHHAFYEVRFKSNYQGEPELRYCVSMYCQQGWDPKTTKIEVTLMSNERRRGAAAAAAACGVHAAEGKTKK
jgi:hypothetical protein